MEETTIEQFCGHCDYKDDREICFKEDQERYIRDGKCGWSRMDAFALTKVTKTTITVGGVEYQRSDMDEIMDAVRREKARMNK